MFGRITTGAYLPVPEVSLECQDLIARMLQPVATSRATAAEVMRHPWFVSGSAHRSAQTAKRVPGLSLRWRRLRQTTSPA